MASTPWLPVLLLPGLDGSGKLFEPMVRCAPSRFAPRPIGYPATLSSYGDLLPIVRAQEPDGPWVCVAESFSGPLAVRIAAARPAGLAALVLVATAVRWSRHHWLRFVPSTVFLPWPGRSVAVRRLALGASATPELVSAWRTAVAGVPATTLASRLRAFARADVTTLLARLEVPVLYLQAAADRCLGDAERASVLRARPATEWRRVEAPHFLLQTQPRVAWEEISRFVARSIPRR